jgi:anaerobic dimethyl sulfoxide reductase subunit A
MLYQGYGMQRRAYGEQVVRAGCVLAAITGNVGVSGGWAGGLGLQAPDGGTLWLAFPVGENPFSASIPAAAWTEAVVRGTEMGPGDGLVGADGLSSDIKLIFAVATNCLVNQHMDVNRSARILADESLVEFLVVQDQFLTPTGRFADLILPACTAFETWGLQDGWKYGDEVLLMPKLVEPLAETRSDYGILSGVADRLGIGDEFSRGRDERQWVDAMLDIYRKRRFPEIPDVDEFERSNIGAYAVPVTQPAIALADFREDPIAHPLPTPSGKIEIFSKELYDMARPDEIPGCPSTSRSGRAPLGRRRSATRSRSSAHTACTGCTRPTKTPTGSTRPFRSGSSSIAWMPRTVGSVTATWCGSSTTAGRS